MNDELKRQELIDNYLDGNMDKTDAQAFERRLLNEADLKNGLHLEKAARQVVTASGRVNLKSKFDGWEAEAATPIRRIRPFRTWAIAAALLVLIAASFWIFSNGSNPESSDLFAEHFEVYRNPIFTRSGEPNQENNWQKAIEAYAKGNYENAISSFEASINEEGTIVYLAQYYLGISYLSQAKPKPEMAITAFNKVLTSDNDYHQQALWYKAMAYLLMNDKIMATNMLKELISEGDFKSNEAKEILEAMSSEQ